MMTPEAPFGQVNAIDVHLTLIGAPDQKQRRDGRRFIAEYARVSTYAGRTNVQVQGRAIKADGDLGVSQRWVLYNLKACAWAPPAPAWLVDALKAAGVTW